jgi:hypothetical protein
MAVSMWGEGSMADCGPKGLRVCVEEGVSAEAMAGKRIVDSDSGEEEAGREGERENSSGREGCQ